MSRFFACFLLLFCVQTVGAAWKRIDSGTTAWLRAIHFVNESEGWIAGSNGTLLFTKDGGETWERRKVPVKANFRDVYFRDEQTGWLLCESDIFSAGSGPISFLLRTDDAGESWQRVEFVSGRDRILKLLFTRKNGALAFGEGGGIWSETDDVATTDRKQLWKRSDLPVLYLMLGGTLIDELRGFIVGAGGTILSTADGGRTWRNVEHGVHGMKIKLNSVFFLDDKRGWVVGENGTILNTVDGGISWSRQVANSKDHLTGISFNGTSGGIIVGGNGCVLRTTDGGATWSEEKRNTRHGLERVQFAGGKGFAIGFGGTILRRDPT